MLNEWLVTCAVCFCAVVLWADDLDPDQYGQDEPPPGASPEDVSWRRGPIPINFSLIRNPYARRSLQSSLIEIRGIPYTEGEDVMELVREVGRAIGVKKGLTAIVSAERNMTMREDTQEDRNLTTKPPSIVANVTDYLIRTEWLERAKFNHKLRANQVNKRYPRNKVYVLETPPFGWRKVLLDYTEEEHKAMGEGLSSGPLFGMPEF